MIFAEERNIKVPWNYDRCVICCRRVRLTTEHLIPRALGGRLSADFTCKECNSRLGHEVEALVKRDPAIAFALHRFVAAYPGHASSLADGLDMVAESRGGTSRARIRKGEARVRSERLKDGSLIQPTDVGRRTVERILRKQGVGPAPLAQALTNFDLAGPDQRVEISTGLEIVKWTIVRVRPDTTGPSVTPLLPAKIAFQFLACHLGAAIYERVPPLDALRESFATGRVDPSLVVEPLRAEREDPIHGICFEGNSPYARVQIRLFGRIAYRVHFLNVAIAGPRYVYTHLLSSGADAVAQIE